MHRDCGYRNISQLTAHNQRCDQSEQYEFTLPCSLKVTFSLVIGVLNYLSGQAFRNFNWIGLNLPIIYLILLLEANYDFTVHHPHIVPGKQCRNLT